ncbi:hypothetical protein AVEN_264001-1 [Araneus ventricosus]|uniref:Uncharacterized protein n=1 Tax=Araneus ventricosus TaxID=182803 RepID=A0A4Y2MZV9_ARAVE|nr:hypothetical protein AVEN_264001-1 [Araneus ventricosus]
MRANYPGTSGGKNTRRHICAPNLANHPISAKVKVCSFRSSCQPSHRDIMNSSAERKRGQRGGRRRKMSGFLARPGPTDANNGKGKHNRVGKYQKSEGQTDASHNSK